MDLPCYLAGRSVRSRQRITVKSPYTGEVAGTVPSLGRNETEEAVAAARAATSRLSRYERHAVLSRARSLLEKRATAFARLITLESGLCLRDTIYEVGRASDVLHFAAMEALFV